MTKIKTDEVQFDDDLKELEFGWNLLMETYLSIHSRLNYHREKTPYDLNSLMMTLNSATNYLLGELAYKSKDSEIYICKHCKKLYIDQFPCYERRKNNPSLLLKCERSIQPIDKDTEFHDYLSYEKNGKFKK
jgi:hypothetical protein